MSHFDLCIIGSGSANSIVDDQFDEFSVAQVEQGTFGGTCINVGCIPTKMFVYPADLARAPSDSGRLGVDLELRMVHWGEIRDRIFCRIDQIAGGRGAPPGRERQRHLVPRVGPLRRAAAAGGGER